MRSSPPSAFSFDSLSIAEVEEKVSFTRDNVGEGELFWSIDRLCHPPSEVLLSSEVATGCMMLILFDLHHILKIQ